MSEDLRVIKTRSNIRKEFLSLLEQYEFRAITVSMIIERCQINRSTFYRNYEDKYALADACPGSSGGVQPEYGNCLYPGIQTEGWRFQFYAGIFFAAPERTDAALPACSACQSI